jgi:hypothetical protein
MAYMKIRILVAVDRDGMTAATQVYDGVAGHRDAKICLRGYDIDTDSIQYRIVEAEVLGWQEPPVPVVKGEAREVGL